MPNVKIHDGLPPCSDRKAYNAAYRKLRRASITELKCACGNPASEVFASELVCDRCRQIEHRLYGSFNTVAMRGGGEQDERQYITPFAIHCTV